MTPHDRTETCVFGRPNGRPKQSKNNLPDLVVHLGRLNNPKTNFKHSNTNLPDLVSIFWRAKQSKNNHKESINNPTKFYLVQTTQNKISKQSNFRFGQIWVSKTIATQCINNFKTILKMKKQSITVPNLVVDSASKTIKKSRNNQYNLVV